jgi:translocator protein
MKKGKHFIILALSILLVLFIGFLGSIFTSSSVSTWYQTLNKPFFNPPNWLFAPVWTLLYLMIGVSLYLVITTKAKKDLKKKTYLIFSIQLFLNLLWSFLFFQNQAIFLAFICIIFLLISIIINLLFAYKISKPSGLLLIPYLIWVGFASLLNLSIWILN